MFLYSNYTRIHLPCHAASYPGRTEASDTHTQKPQNPFSLLYSVIKIPNCTIPRIPSLKIQNIQITNQFIFFFLSLLMYSPLTSPLFFSSPHPQLAQISWTLLLHFILLCSREERTINKSNLTTHPNCTIKRGTKNILFYTNKISAICHTVFLNIA